jgi:hypothetical protein
LEIANVLELAKNFWYIAVIITGDQKTWNDDMKGLDDLSFQQRVKKFPV